MEIKKWLKRGALGLGVAGAVAGGAVVADKITQQDLRIADLEGKMGKTVTLDRYTEKDKQLHRLGAMDQAQEDLNFLIVRNTCRLQLMMGMEGDCDQVAKDVVEGMKNRAQQYEDGEKVPSVVPQGGKVD